MDETRELARRLRMARASVGMTQVEAAKRAEISQSALSLYEKARREPAALPIKHLAKLYDVSLDWLLGDSETMGSYPKND